jgi:cephalosporin-C deacetylase-like acetyl esterase
MIDNKYVNEIKGINIYISEENAPEDFQEIWKKSQKRILSATTNNVHVVEKLFLHKGVDK